MELIKTENLKKNITKRYILALSLIAILSTIAFYTLQKALKESENTAYLVNISGKQRMLSQHLALDIYKLHTALYLEEKQNSFKIDILRNLLIKNSNEMLQANKTLSTGKLLNEPIYELSKSIFEMYFGKMNLSSRVENYNEIIQKALKTQNKEDFLAILQTISDLSEPLLFDLNQVVLQYQKEGENKISQIKNIETIIWILTLFILLLEIIFIFQPMTKYISDLAESKNRILESLQNQVEIRTLYLQNANEKLEKMAYVDPLTGLKNRFSLENDMEDLLKQYKEHNASYAVLLFDIDFFKTVNDTYGHDFGDFVLEEIAKLFMKSFRQGDKIYRTGGEEFLVLLNRIDFENSQKIADNTLKLIENHTFIKDGISINKTISCGLFHSSICESEKYKEILKYADISLYQAKNQGRNQVKIYKKESDDLHLISCS